MREEMKDFLKALQIILDKHEVSYSITQKETQTIIVIQDLVITLDLIYGRVVYFSNKDSSGVFTLSDIEEIIIYNKGLQVELKRSNIRFNFQKEQNNQYENSEIEKIKEVLKSYATDEVNAYTFNQRGQVKSNPPIEVRVNQIIDIFEGWKTEE